MNSIVISYSTCRLRAARFGAFLLAMLALALGQQARAHTSETFESLALTNFVGWLVSSDAGNTNAGYDRDSLNVNAVIRYTTFSNTLSSFQYQTAFRLLDAQSNAVPLITAASQTNTVLYLTNSVLLPSIFSPGITSVVATLPAALKPAVRLDPYSTYRIHAALAERPGGSTNAFASTGDQQLTTSFLVNHFTNMVSGDSARNVIPTLNSVVNLRTFAVKTVPGKQTFQVQAQYVLRRYDDFNLPVANSSVSVTFGLQLYNVTTSQFVPLKNSTVTVSKIVPTWVMGTIKSPGTTGFNDILDLEPADGVQLDSVNHTFRAVIQIRHTEVTGQPVIAGNSVVGGATRLLHFNGDLMFGAIKTRFESIANTPGAISFPPNAVETSLSVDNQQGYIVASPAHKYGDGTALSVHLRSDGTSYYMGAASVAVTGPAPDTNALNGIRFQRAGMVLNTTGGTSSFLVWYPTGFGVRAALDAANHLTLPYAAFINLPLNTLLLPNANPVNGNSGWGCEETKPFYFRYNSQTWDMANGRFLFAASGEIKYVREEEIAALKAAPIAAAYKIKPSNEGQMQGLEGVASSEVVVAADPQWQSARMTIDVKAGPSGFLAHFPHQAVIVTTNSSILSINNDLFVTTASQLSGAGNVLVAYTRDCTEPDCAGGKGLDSFQFKAQDGVLYFTRDGGLTAKGSIGVPKELTWGWIPSKGRYAHTVQPFAEAGFHMPGFFLRGGETSQPMENRAAVLLFTGIGTNTSTKIDFTRIERPLLPAYSNGTNGGFGDYAGLNFRVGSDGAKFADSTLAGEGTGPYPLTGRSKYYVRKGGISGIHEAVFGSFPETNKWYGYSFQVNNFGLAFRDSQNVDSRTEGAVFVKFPSEIKQNFEKLIFNCLGGLEHAQVPATENGTYKVLSYWKADISTLAIEFARDEALACDPGQAKLVLGVKAHAAPFPGVALFGELGFETNGNLITLQNSEVLTDMSSRLKLPSNLTFAGPAGEKWNFTPVNDAFFNNYDHRGGGGGDGWLNIPGKLDAPFFDDLQVHMHCSPDKDNTNAPVYLAGGWGTPNRGYEWKPGKSYFNQNPSDQDNAGWPVGVAANVSQYRDGVTDSGQWLVRAERLWLDVVQFDYPLLWDKPARSFRSAKDVKNDLFVLKVEHKLKYLSPKLADITFGVQYDGIPQISLANMAYDQLGGLETAVKGVIGDALDQGMNALTETLSTQAEELFDPAFESILRPRVLQMVQAMHQAYNVQPFTNITQAVDMMASYTTNGVNSLADRLTKLASFPGPAIDFAETLQQNLNSVEEALNTVEDVLAKDGQGNRHLIKNLMQAIVGSAAPEFLEALVPEKVNDLLKQADPTFDQLIQVVTALHQAITQARNILNTGSEFQQEIVNTLNSQAANINGLVVKAQKDFADTLDQFDLGPQDNPFAHYTDEQLTDLFVQQLKDRFIGSIVSSKLREIIRQRLYDLDASIRQATDSMFQQVNVVMRDLISETAQQLDNAMAPMLGSLDSICGAGKLNGYAHINGDSLKELRVDIYASLKVPSEMEFHGFLLIRELDSENFPTDCLPAGGKATEVTLGADKIPVKFANCDANLAATAKFTFDANTAFLLGMAGGIDLEGKITIGPATIKKLSAALAFGAEENYFSAACAVSVNSYTGMGGIFFGRTCTLEPLKWDAEIQKVVGQPPFTGAYSYVEVWIPVSEALLGIPATCMFQVSAGMGMGVGFFVEGPTFLGKTMLGVSGDFLCIASIYGDIRLAGKGSPKGITMLGSGRFEVELCCLVCISASKTVEIMYQNGSWDIDF
jgi:hypothetical protein